MSLNIRNISRCLEYLNIFEIQIERLLVTWQVITFITRPERGIACITDKIVVSWPRCEGLKNRRFTVGKKCFL